MFFIPAAGDHGLWPGRNAPSCGRDVAPHGRWTGDPVLCPWGSISQSPPANSTHSCLSPPIAPKYLSQGGRTPNHPPLSFIFFHNFEGVSKPFVNGRIYPLCLLFCSPGRHHRVPSTHRPFPHPLSATVCVIEKA